MDQIPNQFGDFVNWGFYSLLSAIAILGVNRLGKLEEAVNRISALLPAFEERFRGVEHRLEKLEDSRED